MFVSAIVVAAGKGQRLGSDVPKQFLDLCGGKTMVELSVDALAACPEVNEIVVAVPDGAAQSKGDSPLNLPGAEKGDKLRPQIGESSRVSLVLVAGGERRQDSVARAFARVSPAADVVVIHDAARPFASPSLMQRTIRAAAEHGAAVAALPVVDTVKQAGPPDADGRRVVRATLARDAIFLAQTPQAFAREILAQALQSAQDQAVTDEATLVERAGIDVHLVEGEPGNVKVTTMQDLIEARSRLASRSPTDR